MSGAGPVKLDASQPKNVGRLFKPRFTKVSTSGTDGNAVIASVAGQTQMEIQPTCAIANIGLTSLICGNH